MKPTGFRSKGRGKKRKVFPIFAHRSQRPFKRSGGKADLPTLISPDGIKRLLAFHKKSKSEGREYGGYIQEGFPHEISIKAHTVGINPALTLTENDYGEIRKKSGIFWHSHRGSGIPSSQDVEVLRSVANPRGVNVFITVGEAYVPDPKLQGNYWMTFSRFENNLYQDRRIMVSSSGEIVRDYGWH